MWAMGRRRVALLACLAFAPLTFAGTAGAQTVEPRVVGGHATTIEEYPWQVAVVASTAKFPGYDAHERQFCGGSLVTASIVHRSALHLRH
jgi:secreted trypsin-like serine protease